MSFNRRTFIKIGGSAFGAAALGLGLSATDRLPLDPASFDPGTQGDTIVPSFCEICFWKCGILAHVKDGRITKIEGNPDHPLANGVLCPRGTGGTGLIYDPDRLQRPLLRRNARGGQDFEEVSWDKALDFIAEKMDALRQTHGPEALALFSHGYGGSWFKTLMKGYGTPNVTAPSYAQCRGAREVGFELTYGSPVGSPERLDMAHSRVITLIGSHLGENMHNTQVQDLAKALDRGAELVVVDPRFSTAAGKARYWLPIKPGTDIALLLAWARVIVQEKLYDVDYLEQYALGFDELKKHLEDKTPEWAAVETGLSPSLIVKSARFIAGARPASLMHPGRHTSWYGDDTQRSRAIAIVGALLGSWGRQGGYFIPTTYAMPKYPSHLKAKSMPLPSDMPRGTVVPFANKVLAHGIRDASLPGADVDYPIKGWFVYGSNLLQALPQPEKTIEALKALDLVVAVDVLPAEITGWADVVLPEATYLERYDDLHSPPYRKGFTALRQPVVPPLYETKPGWWIAKELGTRLGLESYFPWENVEHYLETRLQLGGHSLEELKEKGVFQAKDEPIYIEEGIVPTFETPSGKIELHSRQMEEAGLHPLPEYTRPKSPPPGHYRLLTGRAPMHTFGRTTNNRFLAEVYDENTLWINGDQATELGFTSGDSVNLINQDGAKAGPIKVEATQRIRPDSVFMVHGFGHTNPKLRFACGRGADDAMLCTQTAIDPVMGGTGMNVNFIRLERAES